MPVSLPREAIARRLGEVGYIADQDLATALLLMAMLLFADLVESILRQGETDEDRLHLGNRD